MKNLRPLRICLTILTMILFFLILDYVSRPKSRPTAVSSTHESSLLEPASSGDSDSSSDTSFLYLSGLLDLLEANLESRLASLGVPEEEYGNPGEYLDKDELFEYETKATLASELDENWIFATSAELAELNAIFSPDSDFPASTSATAPEEYKNLADLLATYRRTLTTVEDYDVEISEA